MSKLFYSSALVVVAAVVACSSSSSPSGGGGNDGGGVAESGVTAGDGGSDSSSVDSGASCSTTTENGATACDQVETAYCERLVQCCNAGGSCACAASACTVSACRGAQVQMGYDCSTATYANKTVCSTQTNTCTGDIPLISCSDAINSTANWPQSCNTFWMQFQ